MKFRKYGDRPDDQVVKFPTPTATKQSQKDACDVNRIMARWRAGGQAPRIRTDGFYGDISVLHDGLAQAIEVMDRAEESFMTLPATVRAQFGNDSLELVEWLKTASVEDARKIGIVPPVIPSENNSQDPENRAQPPVSTETAPTALTAGPQTPEDAT